MNKSKSKFDWTRSITEDLIILYEAQPVLYVTNMKDYKNKNKRLDALNYMKTELRKRHSCDDMTTDDITKKVHTIRTQYLKEVNTLKKFLASGAPAEAYTPKLWCFDMLRFLTEGDPISETETNLILPEERLTETSQYTDTHDEEEIMNEEELVFEGDVEDLKNSEIIYEQPHLAQSACSSQNVTPHSSSSGIKKQKYKSQSSAAMDLISSAVKALESQSQTKTEDDSDLFGKIIAAEIRKIEEPEKVREIKKNFFNIIMDID